MTTDPLSRRRALAVGLAAGAAVVGSGPATKAAATVGRSAPPGGDWEDVPVPAGTTPQLWAVSAPGPRTAFAIGQHSWNQQDVTAALHWNGRAWVQRPVPPKQWNWFMDLAAAGPAAAWIVGLTLVDPHPASLHWNGARWMEVAYPALGAGGDSYPPSVAAEPDGTAWSVTSQSFEPGESAVLRFERGGWVRKRVPLPARGRAQAVAARSSRDVWVGGADYDTVYDGAMYTLRWNGREWRRYDLPEVNGTQSMDILPVSNTSAWAYTGDSLSNLVWHWDGTGWTYVTEAPRSSFASPFPYWGSIASDGRGGLWVPAMSNTARQARYLHWDGTTWTTVYGPQRTGGDSLVDVTDLAPIRGTRSLWSVGYQGTGLTPVIERFTPVNQIDPSR